MIKIYADGAILEDMVEMYEKGFVSGFTTNPSLMKKAGITNYREFAKKVLEKITDMPISFEVFSDDLEKMYEEAMEIASWGENVYVKIPIMNSKGESTLGVIKRASDKGVKVNITALYTVEQVRDAVDAVNGDVPSIISVFAGRIADSGVNPIPIVKEQVEICKKKEKAELLWASTREMYNIVQAQELGVDIITSPNDFIKKYQERGKDLLQLSLETVQTFASDIQKLGFSIFE